MFLLLAINRKHVAMPSSLWQWEYETTSRWRRRLVEWTASLRRPLPLGLFILLAFLIGARLGAGPDSALADFELRQRLARVQGALVARAGELELVWLEVARLNEIIGYSTKYEITGALAADIYDIALAEAIDPGLAYRLVRVESRFYPEAVSPKGAVGLTQLMPSTAFAMDPSLAYEDLFDPQTNLHLGFRYLRDMLDKYQGDLRLALLAYNRGPGRVDEIRREGGDPSNGYARAVLGQN